MLTGFKSLDAGDRKTLTKLLNKKCVFGGSLFLLMFEPQLLILLQLRPDLLICVVKVRTWFLFSSTFLVDIVAVAWVVLWPPGSVCPIVTVKQRATSYSSNFRWSAARFFRVFLNDRRKWSQFGVLLTNMRQMTEMSQRKKQSCGRAALLWLCFSLFILLKPHRERLQHSQTWCVSDPVFITASCFRAGRVHARSASQINPHATKVFFMSPANLSLCTHRYNVLSPIGSAVHGFRVIPIDLFVCL